MEANPSNEELKSYVGYAVETGDPFSLSIVENLARYPVTIRDFIVGDSYLGLKNVYPAVVLALDEVYHPHVEGMDFPLRFGTDYREVLLTGGIGCAKTYTSVLGMLYGVYLLSCLRSPHALFGLDPNSEIVFLIQSIRLQTGGVAYRLAREIIEGSEFFSKHFPRNTDVRTEIQFPHNIVVRPVSGELTAAIGMNVVTVLLDEVSFMRHHEKSVHSDDGQAYDQARALYAATRSRIDSRFAKQGRYLIPMWLAGSARHREDFIQVKKRDHEVLCKQGIKSGTYVYDKTIWEVKPWDYPSHETFRVFRGRGSTPPRIVDLEDDLYHSDNTIDVPVELETAFRSQPINVALRDICGIPSSEIGNLIVEVERTKARFCLENMFVDSSYTFLGGDSPRVKRSFFENPRLDRTWFAHLDLSRSRDSTGVAIGYVDEWLQDKPQIIVQGLLEVPPASGQVIPWDQIIQFLFRLSQRIPLYGVTADQLGYNYLREQLVPWGFQIGKISDNPSSDIYHKFLSTVYEGNVSVAQHAKTVDELLALNVDEKTGKVSKPVGGSKDCSDALVSLVELLKTVPRHLHNPDNWYKPEIPDMKRQDDGSYKVIGGTPPFALPSFVKESTPLD